MIMKKFFSIFLFLLSFQLHAQVAANVKTTLTKLRHNYDCGSDDGGVCCGCFISVCNDPDPRWILRAGYGGGNFSAYQTFNGGEQPCGIWDVTDYDFYNTNVGTATTVNVDMQSWEEDGCGSDNTYDVGCANDDDVGWGPGRIADISFRADPPCTNNQYGWYYSTSGYGALMQVYYTWATAPTFTTDINSNGSVFSVCPGVPLSFSGATNSSNGYPVGRYYRWLSSTTSSSGPFTPISGQTSSSYSFTATNASGSTLTTYYMLQATSNCTADFTSNTTNSSVVTVNVYASGNSACNLPTCNTIFVDPVYGNDANATNRPNTPYKTLQKALSTIGNNNPSSNPVHIKIASGTTSEPSGSPIIMQSYVIVEGGYVATSSGNDWQKSSDPANKTTIVGNYNWAISTSNEGVYGIVAGLTSTGAYNYCINWRLQDLTITTNNSSGNASNGNGKSNYALYIDGANNYNIVRCDITSGNATDGLGRNNASGYDGSTGGNGGSGNTGGSGNSSCGYDGTVGGASGGSGGTGGANATRMGGSAPNGSAGGNGGTGKDDNGNGGSSGSGMTGTCSGGGGSLGSDDTGNNDTPYGGNGSSCATAGANGSNGAAGVATYSSGYFLPGNGTNGTAGSGGGGGAGGGGGGKDCGGCCAGGGGGSSGGGGGGGGGAGAGAGGGGGSFGVFVWAGGNGGNIIDSKITTGAYGAGGTGGNGVSGGSGGGASGVGNGGSDANRGGAGGSGSGGGKGGNGGSGAIGVKLALANQSGTAPAISLTNTGGSLSVNSSTSTGGTINNPATVTLLSGTVRNNMPGKYCINSEIDMTKSGGNWGNFPQGGLNLVEDLNSGSTSYGVGSSPVKVYTTTGGAFDISVNGGTLSQFLTVAPGTEFNRTVPVIAASPTSICTTGSGIALSVSSGSFDASNIMEREWKIYLDGTPPGTSSFNYNGSTVTSISFSSSSVTLGQMNTAGTYIVRYRERHNCCGWSKPSFTTFTVYAQPTAPALTPNSTLTSICKGGTVSATITFPTDGTGCVNYREYSIDGGAWTSYTDGSAIGSSANSSISIRGRRDCSAGVGCTPSLITANTWSILPQPTIINQPASVAYCLNGNSGSDDLNVSVQDGITPYTYQWQSNTTTCGSSFSNTGTATTTSAVSSSYSFSTTTASTTNYHVVITGPANSGCTALTSNCATVSILPAYTTGTLSSADQTGSNSLCAAPTPTPNSISFSTAAAGSGGFTYQWYYTEAAGTTAPSCPTTSDHLITLAENATAQSSTYVFNSGEISSGYSRTYACYVTPNAGSLVACGSAGFASGCRKVTVLPDFSTGTLGSGDQTGSNALCASPTPTPNSITFSASPTGSGSFTYLWYYKEANGNTAPACPGAGQSPASWGGTSTGITTQTYTFTAGEVPAGKSRTYVCYVTPTAGSLRSCGAADWASGCRQITVLPSLNLGTVDNTGETICTGGDPSSFGTTAASGANGSFDYQWYYQDGDVTPSAGTASTSGWTLISGANGTTYDPPAGLSTTRSYAVQVDPNGTPDCDGPKWASGRWKVTVVSPPTASLPANPAVCLGGSATLSATISGGAGTLSYIWQYSADGTIYSTVANGTPSGISYSASSNTLSVSGDGTETAQDNLYRLNVVSTASGCSVYSSVSTISVVNDPVLSAPANDTLCQGNSTTLTSTPSGGTGTFNYQWEFSSNGSSGWTAVSNGTPSGVNYSGASSTSLTINSTLSVAIGSNNFYRLRLTSNTPSAAGCDAVSTNARITYLQSPSATPALVQIYTCDGSASIIANSISSGATVTWNKTSGTGSPSTSTDNPLLVTGLTQGATTVYQLLASNSGCTNVNMGTVSIAMPGLSSTVLANYNSCAYCIVQDGNTKTFYNDGGQLIATITDDPATTPDALGSSEVCVRLDNSVQFIQDNLGNMEPYLERQWTIHPASNSKSRVTLYFTDAELRALQTAASSTVYQFSGYDLYVTKYPGGQNGTFTPPCTGGTSGCGRITGENVPATFSASGAFHKVVFDVSTFSTFYIHPALFPFAPLPVELTTFTGWNEGPVNKLQWVTASENNTKQFEIQKSLSATNWNTIGNLAAAGNSNQVRTYDFTDNDPVIGNNYYRLKIIDNDGKFNYSGVINIPIVDAVVNGFVSVFPNPTTGELNVVIQSTGVYDATVSAYDILGKKAYEKETTLNRGLNILKFDLSLIAKGTYLLRFTDDAGETHTTKFVKD